MVVYLSNVEMPIGEGRVASWSPGTMPPAPRKYTSVHE